MDQDVVGGFMGWEKAGEILGEITDNLLFDLSGTAKGVFNPEYESFPKNINPEYPLHTTNP
jgi:hypothetical protein